MSRRARGRLAVQSPTPTPSGLLQARLVARQTFPSIPGIGTLGQGGDGASQSTGTDPSQTTPSSDGSNPTDTGGGFPTGLTTSGDSNTSSSPLTDSNGSGSPSSTPSSIPPTNTGQSSANQGTSSLGSSLAQTSSQTPTTPTTSQSPSTSPSSSSSAPLTSSTSSSSGTSSAKSSSSSVSTGTQLSSSSSPSSTTMSSSFSPSSSSSGASTSTSPSEIVFTSEVVKTINGTPTTSQAVFTSLLSAPQSTTSSSTNRAIIAGSVVGIAAFLAFALAMVMFYRRHQHKKLNFFRRKQSQPRSMLLAGEDLDDYDLGPPMQNYQDHPGSLGGHSRATSYNAGSIGGSPMRANATPDTSMHGHHVYSPSPHLFGMRTSETGSVFQEAVWPPPKAPFVDPLLSSTDDLGRIVDDVMGPSRVVGSANANADARLRGGAPSASTVSFDTYGHESSAHAHIRATSQTALMSSSAPPESPKLPTWQSPLFVTNMGADAMSMRTAASPPPGAKSPLALTHPGTSHDDDRGTFSMGEAL